MSQTTSRAGYFLAVTASIIAGCVPLALKPLTVLNPAVVLAGQTLWSTLFITGFFISTGLWRHLPRELASKTRFWGHVVAALVMATTNLVYIWAVANERLIDMTVGYFANPLVIALFASVFLAEKFSKRQQIALIFIVIGLTLLVITTGVRSWVALFLAFGFPVYITIRRKLNLDPAIGIFLEMLFAAPIALGYLAYSANGSTVFSTIFDLQSISLAFALYSLMITSLLLMFQWANQRIPVNHTGVISYVSPTLALGTAVFIFKEPLSVRTIFVFAFVWLGLRLNTSDMLKKPIHA